MEIGVDVTAFEVRGTFEDEAMEADDEDDYENAAMQDEQPKKRKAEKSVVTRNSIQVLRGVPASSHTGAVQFMGPNICSPLFRSTIDPNWKQWRHLVMPHFSSTCTCSLTKQHFSTTRSNI